MRLKKYMIYVILVIEMDFVSSVKVADLKMRGSVKSADLYICGISFSLESLGELVW